MKDRIATFLADLQVQWLEFLVSAALMGALLGGLVAFYVWWRRRYTRERYAFAALTATVGLVFTGLSVVVMPNWYEVLVYLLGQAGLHLDPPREPHFSEKVLVVLLITIAIGQINRNHREWDGPKSEAHRERERLREEVGLVQEGLGEIRRMLHREPAPVPVKKPELQKNFSPLQVPTEILSWHEQVYELLRLSKPSYYFDRDSGWHELEGCWVGRNTKTNHEVAVHCLVEPSNAEVERFVTYCKENANSADSLVLFVALPSSSKGIPFDLEHLDVTILLEDDLLKDLIDFSSYKRHIQDRFTRDSLRDSTLTFSDVYVSASATRGYSPSDEAESVTVDNMLFEWASETSSRHIALLGDYGQGKSTCALAFAHRLLTGANPSGRVPLLIELRGKSPSTLQPLELLGAWSARFGFDPQALSKLIAAGKTILIFEGFDEMAYVSDYESRVEHLQALWRFCYPRAKLLFTGRRNFFFDDRETLQSLGIREGGVGPYCEPFHLLPFSKSQISKTLEKSSFPATEEILALGDQSESFKEIITRPSTLYMISLLWKTESETLRKSSTSTKVMQLFINSTYMRQAEKQREQHLSDRRRFMMLTVAERAYFMTGVAAYMAAQQLKNQITRDDLEMIVERLYNEMPDYELAKRSLPAMDEPTTPLKERIRERTDSLEAVQTDVRTYGLLVRDRSRHDAYQFPHKSYFEFLYAEFAHIELMKRNAWIANSIKRSTGIQLTALAIMPESIQFLGEIILEATSVGSDPEEKKEVELFRALVISPLANYSVTKSIAMALPATDLSKLARRKRSIRFYLLIATLFSATAIFIGRLYISQKIPSETIRQLDAENIQISIIRFFEIISENPVILTFLLISMLPFLYVYMLHTFDLLLRRTKGFKTWFQLSRKIHSAHRPEHEKRQRESSRTCF